MSVYHDPEALALLVVQQYLSEQGYSTALTALEQASGLKYDDDKLKRGSQLMELVFQHVQQQLAATEAEDSSGLTHSSRASRKLQLQQQHAKLREELMLRSAAADYPCEPQHSLGPFPANLLSVLTWPGEHLIVTGAADGTVRLIKPTAQQAAARETLSTSQEPGSSATHAGNGNNNTSSSSRGCGEVWVTRLAGAGGVLTLSWHPSVQSGSCRFADIDADVVSDCLLLAGCMDGSVHVLHAVTGQVLASAKPHSKYVVAASWAPEVACPAAQQQPQQQQEHPQECERDSLKQHHQQQLAKEQLVATGSYDSSCCLLRLAHSSSDAGAQHLSLEVLHQVPFSGYVQDVCFLPPGAAGAPSACHDAPSTHPTSSTARNGLSTVTTSSSTSTTDGHGAAATAASDAPVASKGSQPLASLQLVVAVRGTNCLQVLDINLMRYMRQAPTSSSDASGAPSDSHHNSTAGSGDGNGSSSSGSDRHLGSVAVWNVAAAGVVNMSEAGDSHVSFSAMRLAVSPCNRYLLIATDSPILLVLRLSDWGVVRRLYGLDADKFHNASVAWHRSSSYVMAGAAHAAVYIYHLGTAKIVAKLQGHTVNVRAIDYDPLSNRLVTCSFDKTIKMYKEL